MPELITFGETMAVMVPKDPGPLKYSPDFRLRMAGAESNTAIGVCKLGHTAGWISALGDDGLGDYVLSAIRAEGVDVSRVKIDQNHRTGMMVKQPTVSETKVFYYRDNSAASHFSKDDIPKDYVSRAKILHLTGITPVLSRSCLESVLELIDFAKRVGLLISFDPNIRKKLWGKTDYSEWIREMLFKSDVALIGLDEAKVLLGTDSPEAIVGMLRDKGVRYVAIKNGKDGAFCADGESLVHIPPEKCTPIDPIGAGDGFNAGFLCGLLEGKSIELSGRMGAIAGAMATETYGDVEGYPTAREMAVRLGKSEEIYR